MAKRKEIVPPEHCASIREFEASSWWKKKSKALLDNKALVCPICNRKRWAWMPVAKRWKRIRFVSHHIRYNNVPHEKDEDIMCLCGQCHDLFHLLLRLERRGGVFHKLAVVAKEVFSYEGRHTFKSW